MRKVNMRYFRGICIVLFLITRLCYGQDASPSDSETICQLVQQVRELQDKVKALEAQRATPSAADTPLPIHPLRRRQRRQPETTPFSLHLRPAKPFTKST